MNTLTVIAIYVLISIVVSLGVGAFIKFGMGDDDDNNRRL